MLIIGMVVQTMAFFKMRMNALERRNQWQAMLVLRKVLR